MIHIPDSLRPLLATVGTTGGAAAAIDAVMGASGPIPAALAALLMALSWLVWEYIYKLRLDRRIREAELAAKEAPAEVEP